MSLPFDLERLYDDQAQALFAFLLNLTRSETDTRDLLQELFIKLAQRPQLLDGVREPRAFLLRLAHNLAIDAIRRRGTREKTHDQVAADTVSIFAPTADPDELAFRAALWVVLIGVNLMMPSPMIRMTAQTSPSVRIESLATLGLQAVDLEPLGNQLSPASEAAPVNRTPAVPLRPRSERRRDTDFGVTRPNSFFDLIA